ncbi:MAG: SCO family protein [Calditrichaeota bacterium]|nr:MAG: SCO family protein [Calditrichota bacterium]
MNIFHLLNRTKKDILTNFIILIGMLFFLTNQSLAQIQPGNEIVGIDEKLGEMADLNFTFVNSKGDSVNIAKLVDRPTILNFVYFNCPSICTPILNGLQRALNNLDLEAGKDYRVLTISFNKDEDFKLANQKKLNYLKKFYTPFPEYEWVWLTGDSTNIEGITSTVGFNFKRTKDDFAHSAALIVLSGEGKVTRYLYGTYFNQFDLKMAIIEASEGRVGPSIAKMLKFCFSYDPEGRRYVFNFLKISASFIIGFVLIFVFAVGVRSKKGKQES